MMASDAVPDYDVVDATMLMTPPHGWPVQSGVEAF